ncbi:MAG: MMPL family transporter [Phycisphaerae bacterium]|nr:MMPL family transporter [Phycisphaerae bacterium]
MIDSVVNAVVRLHRPILLSCLVLALVSIGLLMKPGLREDYTIESLIAADDEEYDRFRRFSQDFVSGEIALFALDAGDPLEPNNLGILHEICESCRKIDGVESPMAISELPDIGLGALFRPGGKLMTIYERLREDPSARDAIEKDLQSNPLVIGNLVGRDPNTGGLNTTSGVLVQVKGEGESRRRKVIADKLRDVLAEAKEKRPDAKMLLGGPLIGLIEIFEAIRRDMAVFTIVVFVLICVALWLIFRRGVPLLVALTAAGMSTLCVLGLSVVDRLPMSLVSQTVVILVIVLGVSMCVHLLVAHEETRLHRTGHALGPMRDARETLRRMLVPCLTVATTTALGFASVYISTLRPVRQLATLVIIGVLLALVLGFCAIPGWARLASRSPVRPHDVDSLTRGLSRIGGLTGGGSRWPVGIVAFFAIVICFCLIRVPYALSHFEADFVKNFREDSNVRRVYKFVSDNLGPVGNLEVVIRRMDESPILGPTAARAIESARQSPWGTKRDEADPNDERQLMSQIRRQLSVDVDKTRAGVALMLAVAELQHRIETDPDLPIHKTISLVDLVKLASVGRLLGVSMLELPRFEWQFALTMVLIDQKLNREFLRGFISRDGQSLRVNLRANESDDVYNKLRVVQRVKTMAADVLGPQYDIEITGLYPLYAKIAYYLLKDQVRAFILALITITTCMCIGLRSIRLGLLSMIPNLMPIVLCLGVMGWAEIPINMATAMMLSVALGIAVDNTIHYLSRFRRELEVDQDYTAAIVRTHRTVGRACVFNSVVIVGGFWVLCLSKFIPTVYFGMMIGVTMIGALAGDIILLPMLLVLLHPIPARRFQA